MEPALSSIIAVVGQVALVLAAGLAYLRGVRVDRPPVGVFNHRDVAVVGLVLVIIPPLYLRLPALALAAVFAVLSTAMLSVAMAPVVGGRRAFAVAVALVAGDIALAELARESHGWLFDGVNNLALAIVVVGVCAMWVQSGVRARHVAALAGCLAVYDVVATSALPLMADLVDRLGSLPLTPMLVWGHGDGLVGIGMGDLLLILVWTMVAEKAFSRRAGLIAAGMGLASVLALFLAFWLDVVNSPVPAMVPLGPLMVGHYLVLARRSGRERTTAEYLATLKRVPAEAQAGPAVEGRPGPARPEIERTLGALPVR